MSISINCNAFTSTLKARIFNKYFCSVAVHAGLARYYMAYFFCFQAWKRFETVISISRNWLLKSCSEQDVLSVISIWDKSRHFSLSVEKEKAKFDGKRAINIAYI